MIDWVTLESWKQDWLEIHERAIVDRRVFLTGRKKGDRARLADALEKVQEGRVQHIKDFAFGFADELDTDSSVTTATQLVHLLQIAEQHKTADALHIHTWFDALSVFDSAVGVAKIEKEEPRAQIGDSLRHLIHFLQTNLFESGLETVELFVYHDPNNEYTVGPEDIGFNRHLSHRAAAGLTRKKHRLHCRRMLDNGLVFLQDRVKNAFHAWLKIQTQVTKAAAGVDKLEDKDPFVIHDRCGLMLVVERLENLLHLSDCIEDLIGRSGGSITVRPVDNLQRDGPANLSNGSSSPDYKAKKLCFLWHGREYEIQFMTFHDYFTSKSSLKGSNHMRYKQEQALRWVFPLLWPERVYGIPWANPQYKGELERRLIARLAWRVNGAHPPQIPSQDAQIHVI